MLELLEHKMKQMRLDEDQKKALRQGLEEEHFSDAAIEVADKLRRKGKNDVADKLIDMSPLFDPHNFWHQQPVPKLNEKLTEGDFDRAIEVKSLDQVLKEPLGLPAGYEWSNINLHDDSQAHELYELLTQNYVEDDDAMFRFDYSIPFLRWALLPPGAPPDWLIGVRGGKKQKLYGFISGIPVLMSFNGKQV